MALTVAGARRRTRSAAGDGVQRVLGAVERVVGAAHRVVDALLDLLGLLARLLSDLASGVTGEVMYVDGGFNTTALGNALPLPQ